MLKPRDSIIAVIRKRIDSIPINEQKQFQLYVTSTLKQTYNIPVGMSSDYICGKKTLDDASDFLLFAIMSTVGKIKVKDYFSSKEITKYRDGKLEDKQIKFPITFNVLQVAEDQWLGSITARRLMEFRDCQIISYNENTQRTMTRTTTGGIERYKITLNRKAVEGIKRSYLSNAYIPNTITFNIPEDAEFDYNEDDKVLTITSTDHLDILDGYHRYIALSEIYNDNPKFDYSMELRLVTFSEEKARQFIWQEDQKTKMSKIDSATFNQFKASNIIVQRLNGGVLKGEANTNAGKIDSAILANILDYTFAANSTNLTRSQQIRQAKEVETAFKNLIDETPTILDHKWDRVLTICVVYCLHKGCYDIETIRRLYDEAEDIISLRLGPKDISRLDEIWERWNNVR